MCIFYSAFYPKRVTTLPHIHPFTHTFVRRRRCQPRKAAARVRSPSCTETPRHLARWSRGIEPAAFPVCQTPVLPPEPLLTAHEVPIRSFGFYAASFCVCVCVCVFCCLLALWLPLMTRYIRTLIQEQNNSCTVIQYIFVSRQVSVDESIYNLPVFLTSTVAPPCGHIYTCTKGFCWELCHYPYILITLVRLLRVSVIHSFFFLIQPIYLLSTAVLLSSSVSGPQNCPPPFFS